MRNLVIAAAALAACVALAPGASAGEKLRVVTGDKWEPYVGSTLPEGGMTSELVMRGFKDAGFEVDLVREEWKRAQKAAAAGDYDAYFADNFTDDWAKDYLFSQTVHISFFRVLTPLESKFKYDGSASVKGLTWCQPRDANFGDLKAMIEAGELKVVQPDTYVECLKLLERGRVDFIRGNNTVLGWSGRATYGDEFGKRFNFTEPVRTSYHYVLFPKAKPASQARIDAFNAAYAKLVTSGWCDEVARRHVGPGLMRFENLPPTKNH